MRRRGTLLGEVLAGLLVLLGILIGIPLNVVSSSFPVAVTRHRPLWLALLSGGVVVSVTLTWLSGRLADRKPSAAPWQVPHVTGWVDRTELSEVVSALSAGGAGTIALTTGLVGAGGFGKTMLAARACQEPAVRRRFPGGIVWITLGRDVRGAGLAARISEEIRNIGGEGVAFTSLEQAGHALARSLAAQGRSLLVVDDVWTADQLEPFVAAARVGRLLVTTRRPRILDRFGARRIKVDAVTDDVARSLLTRDLPPMDKRRERELLELTAGWPLLLSLINYRLADALRRRGGSVDVAAIDAVRRLRQAGPAGLDITDSGQRQTAVAATIAYSVEALESTYQDRFWELGIFAEDAEVPLSVIALLWWGTSGLDGATAQALCERLDGLSLLSLAWAGEVRVVVLHDVIRDFAVSRLGMAGCIAAHGALVNAARQLALPAGAGELDHLNGSAAAESTAWWRLPETAESSYLWRNLTHHLHAAGLESELDEVCCDLRFMAVQLRRGGPAVVEADLARSAASTAGHLRRAIAQNAHLLSPIEPPDALTTILTSRLGSIPDVARQLPSLRSDLKAWTAWSAWPLPDQPPDALVRTLAGHTNALTAVAISPDGTWLVTASDDGTARVCSTDGTLRAVLTGHQGPVNGVAISPDGTWLATASDDGTARVCSTDGTLRAVLTGHRYPVNAVAISPDGTWLATASTDHTVRVWATSGTLRTILTGHTGWVRAVAISPDGTWLATTSDDETTRIWDADGTVRDTLKGHPNPVTAVAISRDGCWLATGSWDGRAQIWAADGTLRVTLTAHTGRVNAVAISPNGRWLATASSDGTARIWDADGVLLATLTGHAGVIRAVAISPNGAWLVTAGLDCTARIWATDRTRRATLTGDVGGARAVAISPDGTWLATAGTDRGARTWGTDGIPRATLTGHSGEVNAVAISPHGSWLATASSDGTARIWYTNGSVRTILTGHRGRVYAVAISPGGSWLATAGDDAIARIWSTDGTLRTTLTGHQGPVNAIAISPDGSWLATVSNDGTARIWSAAGTVLGILTDHAGWVNAVAISPDGSWLATASTDGTARIWTPTARAKVRSNTAIRVDGAIQDCKWLSSGTELCIAGTRGMYRFALNPPGG